jgi:membrane-associated phospholipid phosphatase
MVVNGLMILSTPISGQHYFVDLVAGGLVAWGGIAAAKWLNAGWLVQQRK